MNKLREAAEMALDALEMHVLGFDGVRKMELAIEALESALAKPDETETLKRCLFQMQEAAKALAQPEQKPVAWTWDTENSRDGFVDAHFNFYKPDPHPKIINLQPLYTAPPSKPEQKKESTAQTVDPRVLLGRSNNFNKETENRLCDIERRLAAIETQSAPPMEKNNG